MINLNRNELAYSIGRLLEYSIDNESFNLKVFEWIKNAVADNGLFTTCQFLQENQGVIPRCFSLDDFVGMPGEVMEDMLDAMTSVALFIAASRGEEVCLRVKVNEEIKLLNIPEVDIQAHRDKFGTFPRWKHSKEETERLMAYLKSARGE